MLDYKLRMELRLKYNPDGSSLRNHQLKMLEILKYIDAFCKTNNINYWLSSGTCLGAIRHGGFIPWDDDVDIEMLREDYIKFEKLFKESDNYVLQSYRNDKFYCTPFDKVRLKDTIIYDSLYKYRGIFVDVFYLEYVNKHLSKISGLFNKFVSIYVYNLVKYSRKIKLLFVLTSCFFYILKFCFFSSVPLFRILNSLFIHKELRHTYGVGWSKNIRLEADIFPLKYVQFEDTFLPVPGNYDAYLTKLYGDYLSVPEESKINPPHVQYFNF